MDNSDTAKNMPENIHDTHGSTYLNNTHNKYGQRDLRHDSFHNAVSFPTALPSTVIYPI